MYFYLYLSSYYERTMEKKARYLDIFYLRLLARYSLRPKFQSTVASIVVKYRDCVVVNPIILP